METLGNLVGKTEVKDKNCKGLSWKWGMGNGEWGGMSFIAKWAEFIDESSMKT